MNAATPTLEYLEPTMPKARQALLAPRIGVLKGKRIAFVNNGWICFTKMGEHLGQALLERHGVASMPTYPIPPSAAPAPGLLDRIAAECDAAIVGLAN